MTGDCTHCGACVEACHLGGRGMDGDSLAVNRDKCHGCGSCADACPTGCVALEHESRKPR